MKVVMKDNKGNESLVCESIDQFHGSLVVALLNQNFSAKYREVTYELVELDYVMNEKDYGYEQLSMMDVNDLT